MTPEQSLTVVMVPTTPWTLEGALKSPEDWEAFRAVLNEEYQASRKTWANDPENELRPYPESW